jgi:hypothetical protein
LATALRKARFAPLMPLALAALPLSGCAIIEKAFGRRADGPVTMLPGQYRNTLELLALEVPGLPTEAVAQMNQVFAKELEAGHAHCVTPEDVADPTGRRMLEGLTEGDCTVESLDASGEEIAAEMQCRHGRDMVSHINLAGRITPEASDLVMIVEQRFDGVGPIRIKMHVTSQRIGDCNA